MVYAPVWQDTSFVLPNASSSVTYEITDANNAVLYSGKAYRKPGETDIKININKIAENYVNNDLPDNWPTLTTYTNPDSVKEFKLWINDNLAESFTFSADWSYQPWDSAYTGTITEPINGDALKGMYSFTTRISTTGMSTTISKVNAGKSPTNGCYAMYYKQRNGGWSWFLFNKNTKKTDSFDKFYTDRSFDNTTLQFERNVYHSEITSDYELTTGWLTDAQSDNFAFNLLSSNRIYLHNLYTDELFPAVITSNEATYKTYENQSKHLIEYKIKAQASQKKQLK